MASSSSSCSERSTLSPPGVAAGEAELGAIRSKIICRKPILARIEFGKSWILGCSLCDEPLYTPVLQCKVGHAICYDCYVKVKDQCHLCSYGGFNRCFAMEQLVKNLRLYCTNQQYGCDVVMHSFELNEHASKCLHHPCYCPYSNCQFIGLTESSCNHIRDVHKESIIYFNYGRQIKVVLPRSCMFKVIAEVDCIFILQKGDETSLGASSLSVTSIRASTSKKPQFSYVLKTDGSIGTSDGRYVELRSWVEHFMHDGELNKSNASLVVPLELCASNGDFHVFVTIKKTECSKS